MIPYSVAVGYQCSRGPCCHPEVRGSTDLRKGWYPTTLHDITTQKTFRVKMEAA